jgi:6-phosphogluconate dehydrogenase
MLKRLVNDGHEVMGYSRSGRKKDDVIAAGGKHVESIEHLIDELEAPRIIWLMVPAGAPVDENIGTIMPLIEKGDIIVDGGNSNWHDTKRRAEMVGVKGIEYIDAGVSGGVWGLAKGYCLMVGGNPDAVGVLEPAFRTLAPEDGYLHVGPSGAGHFVKMVHNGIEYGVLQAYAEGFEILHAGEFTLDMEKVAKVWNHGSVIRSWLLELMELSFKIDPHLEEIADYVQDSGEGRWTVADAIDLNVPAPIITMSLLERIKSRQDESFSAKVISALRNQFGGHAVRKKK